MFSVARLVLAASLAALPYWPGHPDTATDSAPVYAHRILVIDTLGVKDQVAVREWNRCHSVHLVSTRDTTLAETPGTITIVDGLDELPRGGWTGDHGMVFLPGGSWTRSVSTIRHELGHALGFGHTHVWSIMGASNHVQPIDCEGLQDYYGT